MSLLLKNKNAYSRRNRIELIHSGASYFAKMEDMIEKAHHSIHLQSYIFSNDKTGQSIVAALKKAVEKGVQIYILVDGYASQFLPKAFVSDLMEAGMNFHFFEPLLRSTHFYFGRRMHHKVFVCDGCFAMIGGINIADRYNDFGASKSWLDYALYIEGDAAINLFDICNSYWKNVKVLLPQLPQMAQVFADTIPAQQQSSVRIRQNDWVKGRHEIWTTYFKMFNQAKESITILCSYFLPGRVLRKRLAMAAQRGVRVKVILAGPSDVMLAKHAERYLYRWMLRNKIEVYEFQPTIVHAKIAVADHHFVTIGSFNVNNISRYASIELNADVRSRPFAQKVQHMLDDIIAKDCIQMTKQSFAPRTTLLQKTMQLGSYQIIRAILNLSTFYFKRE